MLITWRTSGTRRWCHTGHACKWRRGVFSLKSAGFRSIRMCYRERGSGWQNRTQWWQFWGGWFDISIYVGNNRRTTVWNWLPLEGPCICTPGSVQRETEFIRDAVILSIWDVQDWRDDRSRTTCPLPRASWYTSNGVRLWILASSHAGWVTLDRALNPSVLPFPLPLHGSTCLIGCCEDLIRCYVWSV